jgi:putative FmdB family regulatory protein
MGLRVFDYKCRACGFINELFVNGPKDLVHDVACQNCAQGPLERQIAAPRFALDGCSGDFPTAADAWEKRRESHMRKERKNMEEHGSYR